MKRALVIDDEFAELQMLALALEAEGFEVEKAADGTRGIELLTSSSFDLVLCDASLPGARTIDVLAAARAHPITRTVPFVLLAHRFEKIAVHGEQVLEKPIRWSKLRELVASLPSRKA